ncbi:MAG: sialate O-acetylesterase [Saprospiraceae bacterium]|nr:sialate O-acetylesterase [Saprospiraceae bacterium]
MRIQLITTIIFLLIAVTSSFATVRLPKIISDGMVLQRGAKIMVWGWADPGEEVTISLLDQRVKTITSAQGDWLINLSEMKAGGPYTLTITGKNRIDIEDVLIGDVWLCAGQSNMVHQLNIHDVTYADEIAHVNNSEIRHFKIPTTTNLSGPQHDLTGGEWEKAIGDEVRSFSAVAYFFAKKIYAKYQVPIGLINASVGGTPIEAWTPVEGFYEFPQILKIIEENRDTIFVNKVLSNQVSSQSHTSEQNDLGLTGEQPWYSPDFEPKNWRRINIPGYWEDQGAKELDGVVWYRREVELPTSMEDREVKIFLGRIVDADELYINGKKVGNTTYQYPQRRYKIPSGVIKNGKNLFVIRVTNRSGKGGFVPDKPYCIFTDQDTVDLKGYWQYKVGEVFTPEEFTKFDDQDQARRIIPQNEPCALYNAMVAPLTMIPFKGVLWYQGESNSGQPEIYEKYMYALIDGWRSVFNQPSLPIIYAQLPNFMDVAYLPGESNWAQLRESQLKALSAVNTAMTVNIDLGEWNDIHPDNKKDVGERMALAALHLAYGEDIVYSGPIYKSHYVDGNKMVISFTHIGSGLITKDGERLSEFAIAGSDKNFIWAEAKIEGNRVIVWSDLISDPRFVRYAWANNPDNPNLYNKEGLPASPFQIE